jgi:hypothetical protein
LSVFSCCRKAWKLPNVARLRTRCHACLALMTAPLPVTTRLVKPATVSLYLSLFRYRKNTKYRSNASRECREIGNSSLVVGRDSPECEERIFKINSLRIRSTSFSRRVKAVSAVRKTDRQPSSKDMMSKSWKTV